MASASAFSEFRSTKWGDYVDARRNLESALRANPKDHNAELFLSNDLIKLGDFDAAAAHLRQPLAASAKNQEIGICSESTHELSEQLSPDLMPSTPIPLLSRDSGEIMGGMKEF